MSIFQYKNNKPVIGKNCYIADSAEVIGDVIIGDGCYVGPGAVIRGDYGKIIIGNNTSVEENCVLHARPNETCTVGNNVTLGHACIVHTAKIVSDYSVIGMGAIVSDFAILGEWAVVGEGAVVKNNQEIPPGKIAVGIPAKVIGDVTEEYKKQWNHFKGLYVNLATSYNKDLKKV